MHLPPPQFQVRRQGYSFAQVDAFIEELTRALEAGETVSPMSLVGARFSLTNDLGYAVEDVDAWMDHAKVMMFKQAGSVSETPSGFTVSTSVGSVTLPSSIGDAAGSALVSFMRKRMLDRQQEGQAKTAQAAGAEQQLPDSTTTGRNAVQELPATPPWATIVVLVVLSATIGLLLWAYFGR